MSIRSVLSALLLAPCLVRAEPPAFELRLVDVETTDVVNLAADMTGTNVIVVRPAGEPRMELPRQRITMPELRQKALNVAGQKVVRRNDIDVVIPACQRPKFSAVTLPKDERITINFSQILPVLIFTLAAEDSGLELREHAPFADVDVSLRIENQPMSEIVTALAAALNVELRVVGKTLEVHRLADDATCPAAQLGWVTRVEDARRARSPGLGLKDQFGKCGRKKKLPETNGTFCYYHESYPLGEFSYHGFINASPRGRTALLVKPPTLPLMRAFSGHRFSEDFVAVTDVDTEAAHLIRWSFRRGQNLPSEFIRVPMTTGAPEPERPEQVLMQLPVTRVPAEWYALEELLVEEIAVKDGNPVATVRDVTGHRHVLRVGDYMGLHDGKISAIDPAGIDVIEIVPDNLGGYMESPVRLQKGVWYEHPRDKLRRELALPISDSPQQSAFIAAAREGGRARLQDLLAGANIDASLASGQENALVAALNARRPDVVQWLLANKARPDLFLGKREITPLLLAVRAEDLVTARALIEAGARVDLAEFRGETPLYIAASVGSLPLVKFLLSRGANPRLFSGIGITPFTWAAYQGQIGVVTEFIASGIKVEDRDRNGTTMLSAAVQGGELDMVKFLLDRGASVDSLDDSGHSVLDHALRSSRVPELTKLLEARGARPHKPFEK